jgi:hypothetical protein
MNKNKLSSAERSKRYRDKKRDAQPAASVTDVTLKSVTCDAPPKQAFCVSPPYELSLDEQALTDRIQPTPRVITDHLESMDNIEQQLRRQRRSNPTSLNYGDYMTSDQLAANKLKANRVPIPGDSDYVGCCVKIDGQWQVRQVA